MKRRARNMGSMKRCQGDEETFGETCLLWCPGRCFVWRTPLWNVFKSPTRSTIKNIRNPLYLDSPRGTCWHSLLPITTSQHLKPPGPVEGFLVRTGFCSCCALASSAAVAVAARSRWSLAFWGLAVARLFGLLRGGPPSHRKDFSERAGADSTSEGVFVLVG